eukprot:165165_1
MSNQNVIKQLFQFGYDKDEIIDAMHHVNNENDINEVIDFITVMKSYGWQIAYTSDGKKYYQNNITKKTSWENPLTDMNSSKLPTGWRKCLTKDGRIYYQNEIT